MCEILKVTGSGHQAQVTMIVFGSDPIFARDTLLNNQDIVFISGFSI